MLSFILGILSIVLFFTIITFVEREYNAMAEGRSKTQSEKSVGEPYEVKKLGSKTYSLFKVNDSLFEAIDYWWPKKDYMVVSDGKVVIDEGPPQEVISREKQREKESSCNKACLKPGDSYATGLTEIEIKCLADCDREK
jgi:hypothetical protein